MRPSGDVSRSIKGAVPGGSDVDSMIEPDYDEGQYDTRWQRGLSQMKIHRDHRDVSAAEEAPGVDMRVVVGPEEDAPNFVMRVFDVKPGASTPFHTHAWEHEVYILSGDGVVRSESDETQLVAGSVVYVEPEERHSFMNIGDEPFRFICVIPRLD